MPTFVASEELSVWAPPAASPLDAAVWRVWAARGRARDQRSTSARISAVKWASIAVLLGATGLWSHLAPFEVAVRFLVTAGAMVVLFQALQAKYYAVSAAFGALAVFYNPVVPVFSFSQDWQRAVVAASPVPFVLSLPWRDKRAKNND
jgi:hypothetical protein